MPRDANGNYTLVAGNPVVAGTPITTSWANPTLQDMAQSMTNSLSRNGLGGMLVPFQNDDGSIGLPGITWTNETKTGFYRAGLNDMRVSVNAIDNMRWNASGTQIWSVANSTWGELVTTEALADYLPLAGGTVTGPLLVPTSSVAEEAVNNTRLADYLPLTGGAISGPLIVPESFNLTEAVNNNRLNAVVAGYLPVAGGTVTGQVKGITPVAVEDLTRKDYVDAQVAAMPVPVSGTTATGGWTLVGGVYTEWGFAQDVPANGAKTITLNQPMNSSVYSVTCSTDITSEVDTEQPMNLQNLTANSFQLFYSGDSGQRDARWIAIGFQTLPV